jgi:peptidoglycan/LPS O-acetylase OafA/YrhL
MAQAIVPKKQLHLIQGLRGLAALAVVLFHVDQLSNERLGERFFWELFRFGWVGVDFFFVLSGFIITYTQYHRFEQSGWLPWRKFITRRYLRIYPLYWLVMGGVLLLLLTVPALKNNSPITPRFVLNSLLLFPQDSDPILSVGWTLTLILFFYTIASLIFLFPRRLYWGLVGVILIGSATQFFAIFTIPTSAPWLWMTFNSFHWEFAGGCLVAYWLRSRQVTYPYTLVIVGTVGVLLFSFLQSYGFIEAVNAIPVGNTELLVTRVMFTGIPCLFLVLGAAKLDTQDRTAIPGWLNYLGDASYSIYLVHSPVISACTQILAKLGLPEFVGAATIANSAIALLSVAIGCLSYSFLEKPLLAYLMTPRSRAESH